MRDHARKGVEFHVAPFSTGELPRVAFTPLWKRGVGRFLINRSENCVVNFRSRTWTTAVLIVTFPKVNVL